MGNLAELFAFAPEAQLVTDADGVMLEANLAAAELLRGEGELRGRPLDWLVPMEQRRAFQSRVEAALAGDGQARFAGSLRRADGDLPVVFSLRVMRGAATQLLWLVVPLHSFSLRAMAGQMPLGRNTTTNSSRMP